MVNLFNKSRRKKRNSDKIQHRHGVLGRMLRTVDELLAQCKSTDKTPVLCTLEEKLEKVVCVHQAGVCIPC